VAPAAAHRAQLRPAAQLQDHDGRTTSPAPSNWIGPSRPPKTSAQSAIVTGGSIVPRMVAREGAMRARRRSAPGTRRRGRSRAHRSSTRARTASVASEPVRLRSPSASRASARAASAKRLAPTEATPAPASKASLTRMGWMERERAARNEAELGRVSFAEPFYEDFAFVARRGAPVSPAARPILELGRTTTRRVRRRSALGGRRGRGRLTSIRERKRAAAPDQAGAFRPRDRSRPPHIAHAAGGQTPERVNEFAPGLVIREQTRHLRWPGRGTIRLRPTMGGGPPIVASQRIASNDRRPLDERGESHAPLVGRSRSHRRT
jgi:hypothetical protein